MKKFTALTAIVSLLSFSPAAFAGSMNTGEYFQIRAEFRKHDMNEFQAKKACDIIEGNNAYLESKVISIDRSGRIMADMDSEVLSIPDISLRLSSDDETLRVREGSWIRYRGLIVGCKYNTVTQTLFLGIANGYLR